MSYRISLVLIFLIQIFNMNIWADEMYDSTGYDKKIEQKLKSILNKDDLEFRLVDQFGVPVSLQDYTHLKKVIFLAFHPECLSPQEIEQLKEKNLIIINLSSIPFREGLVSDYSKKRILMDEFHLISDSIGFKSCGDLFEYEFKSEKLIFLKNISKNQLPIEKFRLKQNFNFTQDIIPAMERSCVYCHVGRPSLNFFSSIQSIHSWRKMMLRTIRLKRMPPGADTYYHQENQHYSPRDIFILSQWLKSIDDMKSIKEEDIAAYNHFLQTKKEDRIKLFEKIKANLTTVIKYPSEIVPADGGPFYKYYVTNTPTTEDIFFDKFFVKINSDVGHHIALHHSKIPFPKIKRDGSPLGEATQMQLYGNSEEIASVAVNGKSSRGYKFDDQNIIHVVRNQGFQRAYQNSTYFIPKNSYLNLEVHFNPTGKAEPTDIEVSILNDNSLKDLPIIRRFSMTPNNGVVIAKPNEKESLVEMKYTLKEDLHFIGYGLHMHYRGQSGILYLDKKNEPRQILMSFPTYQYKNQLTTFLKKAIIIPKGSQIISHIVYNNSSLNLSNPNSKIPIKIGTSILNEENYLPRIYYLEYRK